MICSKCGNRDHDINATTCRVCGHAVKKAPGATARASSNWTDVKDWRRHLIQRLGAPPVELKEGKTFVFGRKSECDMTIASPKISRKHSEVVWRDKQPVLRDLGSENGTEVNGKPIKERVLEDEDEITIGPFMCTYRCLQGRTSIQVAQELLDSQADTQSMSVAAMTGTLKDMSVYELLETLSFNQKSGTLEVYNPQAAEGQVVMEQGYPLYAQVGGLRGEAAVYHILEWGEGTYRFVGHIDTSRRPNLQTTIQNILTNAKKRDQARASGVREAGTVPLKALPKHYPQTEKHRRPGAHPALGSKPSKRKLPPPKRKRPRSER
jgi:pSer/pThr/pTyr-binding forkhead associated (FHA) protein/ribosomal protein L37E